MKYAEAKAEFLEIWGTLGTHWGISRTMAQIHALLLISPQALSTEEVMEELQISRGNANMNLRALINWGLISKVLKPGERREYFEAEKDIWKVIRQIARERRRRELQPLLDSLNELEAFRPHGQNPEEKEFARTVGNIHALANKVDSGVEKLIRSEETWFINLLIKML